MDCILKIFYNSFFESLKVVLINMVAILFMSTQSATPGFLKMEVFWSKGYDITIFVHDVTNKILTSNSDFVIHMLMWSKFENSSISMRGVIKTSIL